MYVNVSINRSIHERKSNRRDFFYFVILDNKRPCCDGNERTCEILFVGNFIYRL